MRKTPEDTRDAIRRAASAAFCARGYHGTTLQEIAGQVGLSRGAVLHHFNSKADLLNAVVGPYVSALDALLASADVGDPPTTGQRQLLLNRFAGVVLQHREAAELLMRDIAACDQLDSAPSWADRLQQLTLLLSGSRADETVRIQTTAAIGAILHPAASAWLDLDSASARAGLTDAGLAAIGPTTSYASATSGRS